MTGDDLDHYVGRALFADGATTAVASLFGGCPTTTYADNMGVMAATRIFSSAAYYVAAVVAIAQGLYSASQFPGSSWKKINPPVETQHNPTGRAWLFMSVFNEQPGNILCFAPLPEGS
jgi:hypothetical protein